mmetsp:Transcript_12521/g.27225  ORF Transcript_12521/g.27225 Transcript_12521/m.27225 type:complete len:356 (+) Transcript_12521:106-1173(+)
MVQWWCRPSAGVASLLLLPVAAGIVTPEARNQARGAAALALPRLAALAVEPEDVYELTEMLTEGTNLVCCGRWRHDAAQAFQERVAAELGVPTLRLGDVHLANASVHVHPGGLGGWGTSAVLYLDEPEDAVAAQVTLAAQGGKLQDPVPAHRGAILLLPDGGQLLNSSPRRVAFLRVRCDEAAGGASGGRSAFEYYVASWVRKNFIAPYDTGAQRQFFRNRTRYPRYWHGFVWSFLGMFSTVFACIPLAWWGMLLAERMVQTEPEPPSEAAAEVMSHPGTPTKPPTLLPRLGSDARNMHQHHYTPQKPGGNRLLPPMDAGKIWQSRHGETASGHSPKEVNLATGLPYRSEAWSQC